MAHLGVLQVFDHYPCISDNVRALDGQFRRYMEQLGWPLTRMTVVDARGPLPRRCPTAMSGSSAEPPTCFRTRPESIFNPSFAS